MNRAVLPVRMRTQRHSIPWWIARGILYIPLWCISYATRVYDHFFSPKYAWYDKRGVGFHEAPDWQEATSPDKGQHQWAKRALRIWWYRLQRGDANTTGSVNLMDVGLGQGDQTVPRLLPLGDDLAIACRSLGFARLMTAANREITPEQIAAAHARHEEAVVEEAERRYQHGKDVEARWDAPRMGYAYQYESREATIAALTVGPLDRPNLAACPALHALEEDMR